MINTISVFIPWFLTPERFDLSRLLALGEFNRVLISVLFTNESRIPGQTKLFNCNKIENVKN